MPIADRLDNSTPFPAMDMDTNDSPQLIIGLGSFPFLLHKHYRILELYRQTVDYLYLCLRSKMLVCSVLIEDSTKLDLVW